MIMWRVHYSDQGIVATIMVATLKLALEEARMLLDQGMNVSDIEDTDGSQEMNAGEIALACAEQMSK
jgi:metal-dependent HD superfamily phosphatase/phosphodiesterase